jgi:hypothetical protein
MGPHPWVGADAHSCPHCVRGSVRTRGRGRGSESPRGTMKKRKKEGEGECIKKIRKIKMGEGE